MEDFDPSQLAESRLAVFLVATYGEGQRTDESLTFNNWMENENSDDRTGILEDISENRSRRRACRQETTVNSR